MFKCKDVIYIILSDVLYDEVLVEDQELMVERIFSVAMLVTNSPTYDSLLPITIDIEIVKSYNLPQKKMRLEGP